MAADFGFAPNVWRGGFRWPQAEAGERKVVLSQEEWALLVGGIDLGGSKRRAWFRKVVDESKEELAAKPPGTTLLLPEGMIA